MTENQAPYTCHIPHSPIVVYPGSRLEILIEALDDHLIEISPEAYPMRVNAIYTELRYALEGKKTPEEMLAFLMSLP